MALNLTHTTFVSSSAGGLLLELCGQWPWQDKDRSESNLSDARQSERSNGEVPAPDLGRAQEFPLASDAVSCRCTFSTK